jgi:hypothetical protein
VSQISHAPAAPAKPQPSTPTRLELAALLEPLIAEEKRQGPTYNRIASIAGSLRLGTLTPEAALTELDRIAAERFTLARSALRDEARRAWLYAAAELADRAANALRFSTLPAEGPGAAIVPFIREACERKLLIARAAMERACRSLAAGKSTPEQAAGDLGEFAPPGAVLEAAELLERAVRALASEGGAS